MPPSRIVDPSQLTLKDVDSRLGCEKSRFIDDNKCTRITCELFALADLIISHTVEFELVLPSTYCQTGGMKAYILDRRSVGFFSGSLSTGNELQITCLDNTKYTLAVWFYAIRDFFKIPSLEPWTPFILLRAEFRELNHKKYSQTAEVNDERDRIVLHYGSGRTRGKRNYMEDVDFLFESVKITDKRSVSVFGVLDGHGGKECALYCAEDIPIKVSALLRSGLSCPETLFKTFLEVDKEFLEANVGDNSGSTANVAIYDKLSNSLFVANTADTRAILSRNATAYDLSMDRKATDPEEIARISKAGGFVISGRVLGTLAVSRALGDAQLKSKKGVLIPDPEVSCFNPSKQDEFVVIATDGLWDVFSSQGVVDFVRDLLQQENLLEHPSSRSREDISARLAYVANHVAVHAVSNLGSMDNVTVMIVLLLGGADRRGDQDGDESLRRSSQKTSMFGSSDRGDSELDDLEESSPTIRYGSRAVSNASPTFSNSNNFSNSPPTIDTSSVEDSPSPAVQTTVIFKRQNSSDFGSGNLPSGAGGPKLVTRGIAFEGGDDLSSPLVADEDGERADSVLTFHPLGSSSSRAALQTISSLSSGGSMGGKPVVKSDNKAQDDDDLMSFLEDDSNF